MMMDWTLIDDGSLDTVVEITCDDCGGKEEWRACHGNDLQMRDQTGNLDDELIDSVVTEEFELIHICSRPVSLYAEVNYELASIDEPAEQVALRNDDAENGYDECNGPLDWLNSAAIVTDEADDAIHCKVSIGDPRGAFCFTVRRKPNGEILIHTPYPGESFAHAETEQLHPGTLRVK
jgi:hypothetical protein